MPKARSNAEVMDFMFYQYLLEFYNANKHAIRNHYKNLSKKFLDYNDPGKEEKDAYLRRPQFEALEMYVFLKEFLKNRSVHHIFEDWYHKRGEFQGRLDMEIAGNQLQINQDGRIGSIDRAQYLAVFNEMKKHAYQYPNYIYALTMGTGKTILMATCIFYEFILANKFPKDNRYCHNALVFAPDKTVLEALREIMTFDKNKVVPPEYVSWLETHLKFHFLDDTGTELSTIDGSKYNIIISNTQKIILKRQHKEKSPTEALFAAEGNSYKSASLIEEYADIYDFDAIETEQELQSNQRFTKITRLEQLGIYVDEAHHSFGAQLAKDMGIKKAANSLRLTINELAANLKVTGTKVVGCFNYTGTPYVGNRVLPEVVYAYGLREAIRNEYLKEVDVDDFSNTKSKEFLRIVINDFWEKYGESGKRYEGMLPKLAIFGSTIEEVKNDLEPAVAEILVEKGISIEMILVNVGDTKLTTDDDIRLFNRLDTPESNKQFIILVNKGREGWNCRSLFGVALFRKPNSKIFVLQATMRCLRAIGDQQHTATVYLSSENREILENELQENFRLGIQDMKNNLTQKKPYEIRPVPPPRTITLKRIKKLYQLKIKSDLEAIDFEIEKALSDENVDKYRIGHRTHEGLSFDQTSQNREIMKDLTHLKEKRNYSSLTITGEIARYLNESTLRIKGFIDGSVDGLETILNAVNEYNELLYDWIVPKLINEIYQISEFERNEEETIELVKAPPNEFYTVHSKPDLVVKNTEDSIKDYVHKSFHLDTYCFDSKAENMLFWNLLKNGEVEELYFTGMLTHGQTDFFIQYIDPETNAVRTYYPDFYVKKAGDGAFIIEVKGDNKIDDPVVRAKAEAAEKLATASSMKYKVIKSSDVEKGIYKNLLS